MTLVDPRTLAILVATGLIASASAAHAQSAEAEVLFRDGRAMIKAGKLAPGCDKLDASARLEPSVGTLLNLGDCRDKLGKRASAWAAFRKAEAMAKRAGNDEKRQAEAGSRAAQLEPTLSNMTIQVDRRVDGLVIRRNGEAIDAAAWNTAMPVDPGNYTIVAEAPGYIAWQAGIPIDPRNRNQVVTVPMLQRAPVSRAPESPRVAPLPAVNPPPSTTAPVVFVTSGRTWTGTRKFSLGLAIVGAGALGTGIWFGTHAKDLQQQADARCPLPACADSEGLRLNDKAQQSATRANILYAAGGLAAATALVLWFVGSPGDEVVIKPAFSSGQVGVSLSGSF